MSTLKFKTNINCSNCIRSVTPFLNEIDSVESWNVNTDDPAKVLTVQGENASESEVLGAIKLAGFKAELIPNSAE